MAKKAAAQRLIWELLEASPDAVELFTPDGTIRYVNQAAAERHATTADALVGTNIWTLYPPGPLVHRQTVVNQVLNSGQPLQFTDRNGEEWNEVAIHPIGGKDGPVEYIATYTRDITRQIRAEEALKLMSLQLLTYQEDERRRIAQDLHDDIGQGMIALILNLKAIHSAIEPGRNDDIKEQVQETIHTSEEMMRHIRQVFYELRPPSFTTLPLAKVLEALCSSVALSTGLRIVLSSQEQLPPIPSIQATVLYRLVQEGMNNVIKHAKATSIWINLEYADGEISISLEDDGQGFDTNQGFKPGMGLQGLRERFSMLNGTFDVESAPGKGTRLYGSLPSTNPPI